MSINIEIEQDVALVLFDLLSSETLENYLETPERIALTVLEGRLEEKLVEPFYPDYDKLLEAARKSLIDRYGE